MRKRLFAIIMILIFILCVGCSEVKQGENLNEELRKEKSLSEFVKIYNKKYNKELDVSKMEVYSVKPYKKGYLVLTCYRKEVLELKFFYIEKNKEDFYSVMEAEGQYLPKLSVNSLKDKNNIIYFGNLSKEYTALGNNEKSSENSNGNSNESLGKINLTLDNGKHVEEKFKPQDKGYIIVVDSHGMVVDLCFTNVNNEPFNYIKEFINYSHGIYETKWNRR